MLAASCTAGGPRAAGSLCQEMQTTGAFRNPAAARGHPLTQSELNYEPILSSLTGLRMWVFLVKHSSREHKQNEGIGQSNAAVTPGQGLTLGIGWHAQTSQAQQCHPHPKTRHRERLRLQEPLSPLTCGDIARLRFLPQKLPPLSQYQHPGWPHEAT